MKICPNCKQQMTDEHNLCERCGLPLKKISTEVYSNSTPSPITNSSQTNPAEPNIQEQIPQSQHSPSEEEWLKYYIGPKYEKIYNKKNVCVGPFLFGSFWLLYRKSYLYGFIASILEIVISCLIANYIDGAYALFLTFISQASILVLRSLIYPILYKSDAKKKINKIKQKHSQKSTEEQIKIVKKKGTPKLLVPSLIALICTILIVIALITLTEFTHTYTLKDFTMKLTSGWEELGNNAIGEEKCVIQTLAWDAKNDIDETMAILEDLDYENINHQQITINDMKWDQIDSFQSKTNTKYEMYLFFDGQIEYDIIFAYKGKATKCKQDWEKMKKTMEIKK